MAKKRFDFIYFVTLVGYPIDLKLKSIPDFASKFKILNMEMSGDKSANEQAGKFYLNKWYLDFTGDDGEAMIFYSARLNLNHWSADYTSWLNYHPVSGVKVKSRFGDVPATPLPGNEIVFNDEVNSLTGRWNAGAKMIHSRIFESAEGFLDWICWQPASNVTIELPGRTLKGNGYAEQIIMTVPPWKIHMDGLLWGRFVSDGYNLVWISLGKDASQNRLWLNGELTGSCLIENDFIRIPDMDLELMMDRGVILESEKKVLSIAARTIRFIPVLHKVMPFRFLTAGGSKWLSRSELRIKGSDVAAGMSIHEFVNFNT